MSPFLLPTDPHEGNPYSDFYHHRLVLHVPELCLNEVLLYIGIYVCIFSSIISVRFIHAVASIHRSFSFLLLDDISLYSTV